MTAEESSKPEMLEPPRFFEVNGVALAIQGAALPVGALGFFAFYASVPVVWGALLGYILALGDTLLTGFFLWRSAQRMEDPARASGAGELRVLAISFLARLLVLALGAIAISQRLAGQVDEVAFVAVFLFMHFLAIGGWAAFLHQRATKLRSRLQDKG